MKMFKITFMFGSLNMTRNMIAPNREIALIEFFREIENMEVEVEILDIEEID